MRMLPSSQRSSVLEDFPPPRRTRHWWRERLRPACRGIKLGVRGHSRFFFHFFCTALVIAAAMVLRCDLVQWCLLFFCIGLVYITELVNNAIEALFRGLDEESMSRAAHCLDIATGAVLAAGITASIIGGFIFLSRLLDLFDPALPR